MSLRHRLAVLALACAVPVLAAQNPAPAATPAQNAPAQPVVPAKRTPPHPAAQQAPGAGPDKVWVNASTNVYHCPSDRYYGKTKDGKYMTEPDARKAGAHGARNQTCFK